MQAVAARVYKAAQPEQAALVAAAMEQMRTALQAVQARPTPEAVEAAVDLQVPAVMAAQAAPAS